MSGGKNTGDTLAGLFRTSVSRNGRKTAALSRRDNGEYTEYSYDDIHSGVMKAASFLKEKGVKKDGFCALLMENRVEWPILYFAIVTLGAACVPLNQMLGGKELLGMINDCEAGHLIVSREIYEQKLAGSEKELSGVEVLIAGSGDKGEGDILGEIDESEELDSGAEGSPDSVVSLIYTSGTTADPKGVLLTNRNVCANFRSIDKLELFSPSENVLALLPLYHAYSFMVTLVVPFLSGASVTYFPVSFRQDVIKEVIRTAPVTVLAAVPQFYGVLHTGIKKKLKMFPRFLKPVLLRLLRTKLSKEFGKDLRLVVSGGARLEEETGRDLSRLGFDFTEGYGLTETSPIVTFNPLERVKYGSVGIAVPDVEIRIEDPGDSGVGEVCVKGENVMKGYFKRPEDTEEAVKDGWFHTGDLGYTDTDGYLYITGRKKEVIVLPSGKNIYPQNIEKHYGQSPYIKEICVLSSPEGASGNERLTALIVPDMEYIKERGEKNIKDKIYWSVGELSRDLPEYERIHGFSISSEPLPRTTLGKLKRYEVKERYEREKEGGGENRKKESLEEDGDIPDKATARKIMDTLSSELERDVAVSDHLEIDLGVDSLQRVQLAMALEESFGMKFPDEMFYENDTVKKLVVALTGHMREGGENGESEGPGRRDWRQILRKEPPPREKEKLYLEPSRVNYLLNLFFQKAFYFTFKCLWGGMRIEGAENLPGKGPYLICPNHNSYLDGLVMGGSIPLETARNVFYLGYREILQKPAFSWSTYFARLVPIDPASDFVDTMRVVAYLAGKGKIICFFPEGNRSFDGSVQEFKKGTGIMMKELDVPAVPVYIKGTYESWPRGRTFPRPRPIKVVFGKPVEWRDLLEKEQEEDEYAALSEALRQKVKELREKA
ncbi:MAG: AMP-binding protein [Candidatus Omnitrophica bacterium]|nr:AMP-binding protein [Candidatus Omnitrophota bacterium]